MADWNFTHRTARVNGVNIHYVIEGDGYPVVLLHGWPEMWFSWRKQIPALSQDYQVIVPDMRGFGSSEKPLQDYRTRTAATDIYELTRHLGHDKIAIVGHDIGVRVSYRYCLDHEAEVDRLALLDGTHPLEQLGPQTPEGVRERWHSYFHQIPDLAEHLVRGNEGGVPAPLLPQLVGEPGHDVRRGGGGVRHGLLPAWRAARRVLLLSGGGLRGPAGLARRRGTGPGHSRVVPVGRAAAAHFGGRRAGSRGVMAAGRRRTCARSSSTAGATSCTRRSPTR